MEQLLHKFLAMFPLSNTFGPVATIAKMKVDDVWSFSVFLEEKREAKISPETGFCHETAGFIILTSVGTSDFSGRHLDFQRAIDHSICLAFSKGLKLLLLINACMGIVIPRKAIIQIKLCSTR
jgi:hypothetical protein